MGEAPDWEQGGWDLMLDDGSHVPTHQPAGQETGLTYLYLLFIHSWMKVKAMAERCEWTEDPLGSLMAFRDTPRQWQLINE